MIKKLGYIVLLLTVLGCDSEDANDCLQTAGKMVEVEFAVEEFTKVRNESDVSMIIKQGPEQKVILRTGENLLNDIDVFVVDGILAARNSNSCNLFRDYNITQLIVTAPNLTEIMNTSQFDVRSEGILNFPNLRLLSTTRVGVEVPNFKKSGNFYLDLNCDNLFISANGQSVFEIRGSATGLDLNFTDELNRFEGREFIVQDIDVLHRSANKVIVNPQQSLMGIITGTGDLISVNRPPVVEIEERYTGKLIFED